MGITFSTHFCMGRAVDSELAIGMHELNCGMMDVRADCESAEPNLMAPDCCNNEFISIEIADDYEKVNLSFTLKSSFLYAFTYTFFFSTQQNTELSLAFTDIDPPPLEQDYQSMHQTFLL